VRAIVTGGAGFIGSHVVDALVARGDEVLVVDDLSSGRRENLNEHVSLAVADVRDRDAVDAIFDEVRPEACFHLAAQANVRVSVERPAHDADVNVLGTIRVLNAATRHGTRVVFASTGGAIYGECDGPATEDAPRLPLSPYGTSKLAGEEYLALYNRLHGGAHTSLRYGNVYGPRQDPLGEAGVIAIFCGRLMDGGRPMIYGDGRQTRDYVFVEDVVDAFLAAGERPDAPGARLNIATGVETSVLDLYDRLREIAGFGDEPTFAPPRPGELGRIALDCSEAGRVLGWRATVDLREGLSRTWAWAFQEVNAGSVGG
jgi:UDP-glucose 4-epimerase